MRFINVAGVVQRARRYVSRSGNVQDEDVKEPSKLAEVLRDILKRVTELEAHAPPEALEFEVDLGSIGAQTTLFHNFNSPIRWYVVTWCNGASTPVVGHSLVQDASSTSRALVLRSYVAGRAIVRIEPASAGVTGV